MTTRLLIATLSATLVGLTPNVSFADSARPQLAARNAGAALPAGGICAHRGDRATCPENTVPAFLSAAYHAAGGKVNYFRCNKPSKLGQLLARGIDFPLTDNLKPMVEAYRLLRGVPCVPPDPERGFRYLPDSSPVTGRSASACA